MFPTDKIDTKRGKEKLNYDGHLYIFDKFNKDESIKFWRCEHKSGGIDNCKGRIWTTLENTTLDYIGKLLNHLR
uniref:FLYWCH-type domain-containing protein n=1 Tax=Meloidogyne incognita TaxID=6306 RepID=A0A914NHG6_MELIC